MVESWVVMLIAIGCLCIGACIVGVIMWKPWNRGFDEGWEASKKHHTDWDKGFNQGWQSCIECIAKETGELVDCYRLKEK